MIARLLTAIRDAILPQEDHASEWNTAKAEYAAARDRRDTRGMAAALRRMQPALHETLRMGL